MKRQLCSYDMFAVPEPCYLLNDEVGDMYFCNLRCFAIWAVQRVTHPGLGDEERSGVFHLSTPTGEEQQFAGIAAVATWVISKALCAAKQG
jgi:hypothetical protein